MAAEVSFLIIWASQITSNYGLHIFDSLSVSLHLSIAIGTTLAHVSAIGLSLTTIPGA
jgi:hypothetical protein